MHEYVLLNALVIREALRRGHEVECLWGGQWLRIDRVQSVLSRRGLVVQAREFHPLGLGCWFRAEKCRRVVGAVDA